MLAIISDLHLTDGQSGETISHRAFELFRERLKDACERASWRRDASGKEYYKPIERCDVVLLGDILDLIRSPDWLNDDVRPWDDPHSDKFLAMVRSISDKILAANKESLNVIRSLHHGRDFTLRRATRDGKPAATPANPRSPKRRKIDVRVHYMVGNHDWFYHLRGAHYDAMRQTVTSAMGLANPHNVPFPHDPDESEEIRKVMEEHHVFARHGDVYDPMNF